MLPIRKTNSIAANVRNLMCVALEQYDDFVNAAKFGITCNTHETQSNEALHNIYKLKHINFTHRDVTSQIDNALINHIECITTCEVEKEFIKYYNRTFNILQNGCFIPEVPCSMIIITTELITAEEYDPTCETSDCIKATEI